MVNYNSATKRRSFLNSYHLLPPTSFIDSLDSSIVSANGWFNKNPGKKKIME